MKIENLQKKLIKFKTKPLFTSEENLIAFNGKKILTYGTFDLFHIGHQKIIDHAIEISGSEENVYIGVSSDNWNKLKNKKADQNQDIRLSEVKKRYKKANVFLEDHKLPEETWPEKWDEEKIDLIIMGEDHVNNLSYINNLITPKKNKMQIMFFERTPIISSTLIRNQKYK